MKKIPSLFQRNYDGDRKVRDEVVPGTEWVIEGEGIATQKLDGTCCMIRDGVFYKRHEVKQGKQAPYNFEPAQAPEPITGNVVGWVPVGEGPEDRWHREAYGREFRDDGTYELIGPKVQGNPERLDHHHLARHGEIILLNVPRSFDALRDYLKARSMEGIVWHHPDGRMVKVKRKDFA